MDLMEVGEPSAAFVTPTDATTGVANSSMPLWVHDAVLVFFVAGVVILALMMVYEVYSIRREI